MTIINELIKSITDNQDDEIYKENYRVKELSNAIPTINKKRLTLIPWSGGLDSTACVLMAIESGVELFTYYVDYGQTYAAVEQDYTADLRKLITSQYVLPTEINHSVINVKDYYAQLIKNIIGEWGHIFPFRNFVIILKVIDAYIHQDNYDPEQITELWFPAVQGEVPYSGGDKSRVFISHMQQLLYEQGLNIDLVTPLITLEKSDIIAWSLHYPQRWNVMKHTYSCFSGDPTACSNCIACFRKIVAYGENGIEDQLTFPIDKEYIFSEGQKYLQRFNDFEHYSRMRTESTKRFLQRLKHD